MASSSEATSVEEFLVAHNDAEELHGRIRCVPTGHEMPAQLDQLLKYWGGKRYRHGKEQAQFDFTAHEPWIEPHKKAKHLLYCTLTKQPLSKQKHAVEGHVSSKRYQRLLSEKQQELARARARKCGDDEDEGEEIEDSDAEDDAKAFLQEGAFWEDGNDGNAEGDDAASADSGEVFWTCPKIYDPQAASSKRKSKDLPPARHTGKQAKPSARSTTAEADGCSSSTSHEVAAHAPALAKRAKVGVGAKASMADGANSKRVTKAKETVPKKKASLN